MTAFIELDSRQRRIEVIRTIVDAVFASGLLFAVYYLVPFTDLTTRQAVLRLALGIVGFALILVWQLRRVASATFPVLRAVHALALTIPIFLVVFASVYLSLSLTTVTHFSEPLDHTGAMYLAITVFSTVGFGDITPESEIARIVVSIQMLLDLVVLGVVVRLFTAAAKSGAAIKSALDGDGR